MAILLAIVVFELEAAEALAVEFVVAAASVNKKDRACVHRTIGSSAQCPMSVSRDRRDNGMSTRKKEKGECVRE